MKGDIQFSTIKKVFVVFVVIVAVIQASVWLAYKHFRAEDQRRDVRRTLVDPGSPVPPEPLLQVDPQQDFQEYLRRQQNFLTSYGWSSRAEGRVHIPIERAMEMVIEREKR